MNITTLTVFAAVLKLGSPFTDHAVLQREKPVPIWGFAEPNAAVAVSFAGNTVKGVADAKGRWSVTLPAMSASKEPRTLTVTQASQTSQTSISDILVGEVWFASGQSNMEMPLWDAGRKRFRDKTGGLLSQWASNANLRVVLAPWEGGHQGRVRDDRPLRWTVPTRDYLVSNKFSAVAYYFGKELQPALDVPVGIMAAYVGGTPIKAWVPDCGWNSIGDEPHVVTNILPRIAARKAADGVKYEWTKYPGDLWNEMVASYVPYAMRGMIWYQGESDIDENRAGTIAYAKEMRALMDGWRREFGCGDLKLLFVEIAPFFYPWLNLTENDDRLARLCDEQQRFAADEPDAHLACIADIGDLNDIHPCRKQEVAQRLAALAFQHAYGMNVKADPPRAVAARLVAPGTVDVELAHGDGLYRWMQEVSLWTKLQKESSPFRFEDAAGRIVDCDSVITNGRVRVTSAAMPKPAYVTHLRRATDESNIYNDSTLPLGTFKLKVEE